MEPLVRWLVAGLVTVAAFAVATWVGGAMVLPIVMKDGGVRWGVAGGLGVAVAALAALWGHSYAMRSRDTAPLRSEAKPPRTGTGSGTTRNKISGGTFHGPVMQGRDISGPPISRNSQPPTADPGPQD